MMHSLISVNSAGGWEGVQYKQADVASGFGVGQRLRSGDQALVCCELYAFLSNLKIFRPREGASSLLEQAELFDPNALHVLEWYLLQIHTLPETIVKSNARLEAKELDKYFPLACAYAHSSVSARNIRAVLPKALKVALRP